MKKLLIAFATLLCFIGQAQNSFKLKKGSVLTYEVQEDTTKYNLIVTIESASPLKFSYKSSNGKRKGALAKSSDKKDEAFDFDYFMPKGSAIEEGAQLLLPKAHFDKVYKLYANFRDGVEDDTTTASIPLARKGKPIIFWGIGFEQEEITANKEDLTLHTYAVSEKGVDFPEGYIIRVNTDADNPLVTFIYDAKNKFSVALKDAKGVEVYEYIH